MRIVYTKVENSRGVRMREYNDRDRSQKLGKFFLEKSPKTALVKGQKTTIKKKILVKGVQHPEKI